MGKGAERPGVDSGPRLGLQSTLAREYLKKWAQGTKINRVRRATTYKDPAKQTKPNWGKEIVDPIDFGSGTLVLRGGDKSLF